MKLFICIVPVLVVFLFIQSVSATPGDIIWQQTLGGPAGEEWGYSLDSTADGGLITTGIAYSKDTNVSGAHGNGDLWVVRLSPSGEPLWNRAFGGNESDYGLSIKTTSDGGSVIVGTTGSNTGDISGYHGNGDLWVLRLSAAGEPLWQKVYGGNQTDEGGDILQTPDGGYVLTGYTMSDDGDVSGHHGGGDLWMIRLDQNGEILWQKAFGGTKRESGSSIIMTSDGGYAMTGNSYSIDGDVTASHGSSDLWVLKTGADGNLLWQKTFGGSKLDWGHSLVELPGGDLIVSGVTASSDGDISINHGAGDIWVIRLSPSGDKIWEKTYGGNFSDNVWKVEASPSGGVYLSGETFSVDGDFTGNHGDADLWVAEVDGNGTLLWYQLLGGQNYESGSWLKLMPDGNLTACGTTRSADGDIIGSRGEGDLWIVKVDTTGVVLPPVTSSENVTPVPDASVASVVTPVVEVVNTTVTEVTNVTPVPNASVASVVTPVVESANTTITEDGNVSPILNTSVASVVTPVVEAANTTVTEVTNVTPVPNASVASVVTPVVESANTAVTEVTNVSPIPNASVASVVTPVVESANTTVTEVTNVTNLSLFIIIPIPGLILIPTDPDGDGQYEDLNGNSKADLQDSAAFFSNYDWIGTHYPSYACDFNKNGILDFGDINALYMEVSA